jgi:hypothetical protein
LCRSKINKGGLGVKDLENRILACYASGGGNWNIMMVYAKHCEPKISEK